jgi:hypothetical protein
MEPDVAVVREAVAVLLEKGKPIICVPHSYGGTVLTEAIGTLAQSGSRGCQLVTNGIKRLVYVSALVPQLGESQVDVGKGAPLTEHPIPVYYRWVRSHLISLSLKLISFSFDSTI